MAAQTKGGIVACIPAANRLPGQTLLEYTPVLRFPIVVNEADYEHAVSTYYEALYAFGYSLAGNEDDACELTQETYCRLLTKGSQLRDTSNSRISTKVQAAIKPPAHLKSQLLAQRKIVRPVAWWKMPAWQLAAAACLAFFMIVAAVWLRPDRSAGFVQYRSQMAEFAAKKLDRLDLMSRDVAEVRRWLAQRESHGDLVLPAGLDGRPSLGCRLLDWKGHKVSLVCFELENKQVAHLLVVDSAAFKDAPTESPVFNQDGDVVTASWSRGGKTYVIASKEASQTDLMKLL